MIAISAVQSSAQTFSHNAILFTDISNNAWYNQAHWLIEMTYARFVNFIVPDLLLKYICNSLYGLALFVCSIFFTITRSFENYNENSLVGKEI